MHCEDLGRLQEIIGYTFQDPKLLLQALTHTSFDNEQKVNRVGNYERLEFLGDAVLEVYSSRYLYFGFPELSEGELTKRRAALVCEPALAKCAREMGLDAFIRLGRGEEMTGGRGRDSIVSDVMEAVIGALSIDAGLERAGEHILRFVLKPQEGSFREKDNKSLLQEMIQGQIRKEFHYEVGENETPDPDRKFHAALYMEEELIGEGDGHSKKAAEQKAAGQAILLLKERKYVS
jgi:ribonuclease-3